MEAKERVWIETTSCSWRTLPDSLYAQSRVRLEGSCGGKGEPKFVKERMCVSRTAPGSVRGMGRFLAVLSLLALLLGAAGCGSSGSSKSGGRDQITVGVIPIVDVAPIYLGKQKGFFAKRGIDLTLQQESGGAAAVPGVVSGQFKFAFGNVTSLLVAKDKGLPVKVVANGNASTGKAGADFGAVVVPKDSPIKNAADLSGKTVAVNNLKNIGDTTVRQSVRKAGGDPNGIKFIELAFPDMPAAVADHKVDAAW